MMENKNEPTQDLNAVAVFMNDYINAKTEIVVTVKANSTGNRNNKYANMDDILAAVTPILKKYNLLWSERQERIGDHIHYECKVRHINGIETPLCKMFWDYDKNQQINGSNLTYNRKYAAKLLFGFHNEADDDGQEAADIIEQRKAEEIKKEQLAAQEPRVNEEQQATLWKLIKEFATENDTPQKEVVAGLLQRMKVKLIKEIPASRYEEAVTILEN